MSHKTKPPRLVTRAAQEGICSATSAFTNSRIAFFLQVGLALPDDPEAVVGFEPIGAVVARVVENLAVSS